MEVHVRWCVGARCVRVWTYMLSLCLCLGQVCIGKFEHIRASYPSWERVALPFTPVGKTHDCPLYRWPRQLGAAGEVRFAEFLFL